MKNCLIILVCSLMEFIAFSMSEAQMIRDTTDGLPSVIDLTEPQPGIIIFKPPLETQSFGILKVMDINHDEYNDIIAVGKIPDISNPVIYIIYGSQYLLKEFDLSNTNLEIAKIVWECNDKTLGMSYSNTGDVNGDGLIDFIFVGRRNLTQPGDLQSRFETRIYVVQGRPRWQGQTIFSENFPGVIQIYALIEAWRLQGDLGKCCIGDVNGDGKDDIIFSYSNKYVKNVSGVGQIYIVYGSTNLPAEINAEKTEMKVTKIQGDTLFQVTGLNIKTGDFDADNELDLLLNCYGPIYIIYGPVLLGQFYMEPVSNLMNWTPGLGALVNSIEKDQPAFGAGDINGDGCDDLFIGYDNYIWEQIGDAGRVYILFGKKDYVFSGDVAKMRKSVGKINAVRKGDNIGSGFSFLDVNGDGYEDCIIYPFFTVGIHTQYLLYGRKEFPDSIQVYEGFPYGTTIHGTLMAFDDVNNDGYDDIISSNSILSGRGKLYKFNETITKSLTQNKASSYHFRFSDSSDFHFQFERGTFGDNAKICLTHFGKRLPDSLQSIAKTDKVVSFIQADLIDMGVGKYSMRCFLTYNDSMVNALGIREDNLIASWWDKDKKLWGRIPSEVDKENNKVTFSLEHLSLLALTDRTDSIMADIHEPNTQIPLTFDLLQNYPNPFNPVTIIKFQIPRLTDLKIKIYNILGQEIKTMIDKKFSAGSYELQWDGTDSFGKKVASGIYIYRIETSGGFVKSRKLIYLK